VSRLARGISLTLITRLILLLIGVITSVILARALGPEGRGQYALLVLIPALFQLFGGLGVDQSVTYLVARRREEARGMALSLAAFVAALGLALIAAYTLLDSFPAYRQLLETATLQRGLLWILVVLLPVNLASLCLVSALLGLERYRLYNIATSITPLVTLLLLAALLSTGGVDVRDAVLATAVGQLLGLAGSLAIVLSVAPGPIHWVPGVIRESIAYGWKILGASIAWFLHYRSDMFLVGYLAGPAALGYYAVAVGLAEKLYMPPSAVGTVLFPRVAAGPDQSRELTPFASRHTLWLTIVLGGILAIPI
jgi:O-antigen/teichoic acid export membrane protein